MSFVGRSPVRVIAPPATAPQEAMAASLQAHIDELVQKNRTCEHTIKRLQQALADEKERGVEAINLLKNASLQEREEWKEGCDSLLASHRIVHLRTLIELDKSKLNEVKMREDNRRERVEILRRDYKLTLFQAKETQLEAENAELRDQLEKLVEQNEQHANEAVAEYDKQNSSLNAELARSIDLLKESSAKIKGLEHEIAGLQADLTKIREEKTIQDAQVQSSSVKFERLTLQIEGAKTNVAELESTNAELKRTNMDLKRQLDRWQNLETKGDSEMESIRKKKIEVEVQAKELQERVKELEKAEKASAKALEKEQKRVEKLRKENDRMAEVTEEAQDIAAKAQEQMDERENELKEAYQLINELKGNVKPKQSRKDKNTGKSKDKTPVEDEPESHASDLEIPNSEREVEHTVTPVAKSRPSAKASGSSPRPPTMESQASKKRKYAIEAITDDEVTENARTATSKNKRKRKDQSDSEDTTERARGGPRKGKDRAATITDEEPQVGRRKKKITADDSGLSSALIEPESEAEVVELPKKRRKRIFGAAQPVSFPWDDLPKGDGGLNIPTELSPVKESDSVPSRSVFGRVGSAFRWS